MLCLAGKVSVFQLFNIKRLCRAAQMNGSLFAHILCHLYDVNLGNSFSWRWCGNAGHLIISFSRGICSFSV